MRAAKIGGVVVAVYVVLVIVFESLLGYYQPEQPGGTMTITVADGNARVVARLTDDGGNLYVAANHWPRGWYRTALANPAVDVTFDGETRPYRAVLLEGDEYDRVNEANSLGFVFKLLTGFPPREIMRLDPA